MLNAPRQELIQFMIQRLKARKFVLACTAGLQQDGLVQAGESIP